MGGIPFRDIGIGNLNLGNLAFLFPGGWQGEFVEGHDLPKGIVLPADLDMEEETTDARRPSMSLNKKWKHEAIIVLSKPGKGDLAYTFEDDSGSMTQPWRIRVRAWMTRIPQMFRVRVSRQPTRLALLDPQGAEILIPNRPLVAKVGDPLTIGLPLY